MKTANNFAPVIETADDFKTFLVKRQNEIENALSSWYALPRARVVEASCYSLLLPSKRLRPIFCLETAAAFGVSKSLAMPAAMALEMIHSYSLVHDDLPSMDNDDLRRGKPTNHVVYGEAMAILAGDGLLTSAFEVLATAGEIKPEIRVAWTAELAKAAGLEGMVLGQALDMEGSAQTVEELENLHRKKTGALLAASVTMGAMAAGASQEQVQTLRDFALDMGLAFQIKDDVLDVEGGVEIGKPVKSDEKNQKPTYVSLLGLSGAKNQAAMWSESALSKLQTLNLKNPQRLHQLTKFVIDRSV